MIQKNPPIVNTLAALKELHFEAMHKRGLTKRALDLLALIMINWAESEIKIAPAVFRRDYRRDSDLIRWLEERRFLVAQNQLPYEPQFSAFCATLVGKKRIAVSLFRDMKPVVRRALEMLDRDPLRTVVPFDEFVGALPTSANTVAVLKLLGSASLGIHLNSDHGAWTVQFSEETLKGRNLLGYVSSYLDMTTRSTLGSSAWSPTSNAELGTFSIDNLLLVEEVHKHATRALSQHNSAPDAAISSAKSTLESTLKYIAHAEGIAVTSAVKLPELFRLCRSACGLGSEASHKMGRSIASLCTEIAEARNALGDSHGKSPGAIAPTRSEARFIVGVALHLSECLLERHEVRRMGLSALR